MNKKSIKSKKFLSKQTDDLEKLNFTNLYPIIDNGFSEAYDAANKSSQSSKNIFYFCKNLTLAKQIRSELISESVNFTKLIADHIYREVPENLELDTSLSGYTYDKVAPSYKDHLNSISEKYTTYQDDFKKIQSSIENNTIENDLSNKCSTVPDILPDTPNIQPITPPAPAPAPTPSSDPTPHGPNSDESKKDSQNVDIANIPSTKDPSGNNKLDVVFVELDIKNYKVTTKVKDLYSNMLQLYKQVDTFIKKFSN